MGAHDAYHHKEDPEMVVQNSLYMFFPLSSKSLPFLRFVLLVFSLLALKYFKLSFCPYLFIVPVFPPYFVHMPSLLSLALYFKAFLSFYFMSVPSLFFFLYFSFLLSPLYPPPPSFSCLLPTSCCVMSAVSCQHVAPPTSNQA